VLILETVEQLTKVRAKPPLEQIYPLDYKIHSLTIVYQNIEKYKDVLMNVFLAVHGTQMNLSPSCLLYIVLWLLVDLYANTVRLLASAVHTVPATAIQ